MAVHAFNLLAELNNSGNATIGEGHRRAAKLPPAADFAGAFTSP
jgi:hypothetical protein